MPTPPSTWYPGPLSPQQLNSDLYSINGTGYATTGILFHSHRVLLHESLSQSRAMTVSTAGTWNVIAGTGTTAYSIIDTGALFGQGCEQPGGSALFQFTPNALATSGVDYQPGSASTAQATTVPSYPFGAGGIYLAAVTATAQTAATGPAAIGTGLEQTPGFGEVFVWQGGIQPHTTGTQGASYFLDLISAGGGAYGTVAGPVADQQVATLLLPQGNGWVADWSVEILGTASTADVNNFSLVLGTQTVATSTNAGAIGIYSQTPYTANSTLPTGEYLSVTAGVTTPTSAATYGAVLYGPGLPQIGNGYTWQPSVFLADGSATSEILPANAADTAGFTARNTWAWTAVAYQGQILSLNGNAYSANGDLTGWTATTGSTVTAAAPPGNPPPQPSGVLLTPSGTTSTAAAFAGSFPATAASVYQVTSEFFTSTAYTVKTGVNWYDAAGNFLSATAGGTTLAAASVWTPVTSWNTAPASAAAGTPFAGLAAASGNVPATVTTYIAGVAAASPLPPSPQASWSGPLTSTLMNGPSGPNQALTFLNNPPAMRLAEGLVTSIPNTTPTVVSFPTAAYVPPGIDTWNAYNTTTGAYVAPVNGLYLAFACLPFTASSTGARYAGFRVTTGGTATTFGGPAYSAVTASGVPTSPAAFRVLDLAAGDTVAPVAYQSSGGSLALADGAPGYVSRFGLLYLCPYSAGGVLAFTPPLTSFHWFAGIPPAALGGYLDEHLGNDLNFLVNRPYFTGYQAVAQSGLGNGTWNPVTIDTPGGLARRSLGDNYAGWNAASNAYVAQQPGWYLCLSEVYASLPSAATGFIAAGFQVPTSGGVPPSNSPDQYQTMFFPKTTGPVPGAAAIGIYYLAAGESVQPMIKCAGWGGNYSTFVSSGPNVNSQFTCVWIAE